MSGTDPRVVAAAWLLADTSELPSVGRPEELAGALVGYRHALAGLLDYATEGRPAASTAAAAGPFETERQARETPAARAVHAAFSADPGPGRMTPHNHRMLCDALDAAGVTLGAYDHRIVVWLAGWEPATCAVIAGLITRAHEAGGQQPGGDAS